MQENKWKYFLRLREHWKRVTTLWMRQRSNTWARHSLCLATDSNLPAAGQSKKFLIDHNTTNRPSQRIKYRTYQLISTITENPSKTAGYPNNAFHATQWPAPCKQARCCVPGLIHANHFKRNRRTTLPKEGFLIENRPIFVWPTTPFFFKADLKYSERQTLKLITSLDTPDTTKLNTQVLIYDKMFLCHTSS